MGMILQVGEESFRIPKFSIHLHGGAGITPAGTAGNDPVVNPNIFHRSKQIVSTINSWNTNYKPTYKLYPESSSSFMYLEPGVKPLVPNLGNWKMRDG